MAKERRREALGRRRTAMATGAAIGAVGLFAPAAQAATYEVNTPADHAVDPSSEGVPDACEQAPDGDCTLRDAIHDSNLTLASDDVVTFASVLTGNTIHLEQGEILISDNVDVDGPGADALTVSGENLGGTASSRILRIQSAATPTTISGLTFRDGDVEDTSGGAIAVDSGADVTISDAVFTDNEAEYGGGAILNSGELTLVRTDFSGNTADGGDGGGGGALYNGGVATVQGGVFSGNRSEGPGGAIDNRDDITLAGVRVTDNTAAGLGGGIVHRPASSNEYAPLRMSASVVSGNAAGSGGGVAFAPGTGKYAGGASSIARTTISGNEATANDGGGLYVTGVRDGEPLTISQTTISGNSSAEDGGGVMIGGGGPVYDAVLFSNSTVSGNTTAVSGAGVSLQADEDDGLFLGEGSLELANSTIADNAADTRGGGIYLPQYVAGDTRRGERPTTSPTVLLTSTLVGDNTADGAPSDLDRADGSPGGGFDLAFSLVEARGDAPVFEQAQRPNVLDVDPQLGDLADNEGETLTHMPAITSPAVDKGDAEVRLDVDQRDVRRTVDTGAPNAVNGDGTDIGAVERLTGPDAPPQPTTTTPGPTVVVPGPTVVVPGVFRRVPTLRVTRRLRPSRDRRAPVRFRLTGRIVPPAGLTPAEACSSVGVVSVQVKRRSLTLSTRRVQVKPDCTYSSTVTFRRRARLGRRTRRLKFTVRWLGNQALLPLSGRPINGRIR